MASGQTALTKCTVPVYAAGILGAFGEVTLAAATLVSAILWSSWLNVCSHKVIFCWCL